MHTNERIRIYGECMELMSESTDDFLFLWEIGQDQIRFFGPISERYTIRNNGKSFHTMEELSEIVYDADRQKLSDTLQGIRNGEIDFHDMDYRWVNRCGETVWVNCRGKVIRDEAGVPVLMMGRVSEEAMRHLFHPLTGLGNQIKMKDDMRAKLDENRGFLMLLDIDGLTVINLNHGREYGNELMKEIAGILNAVSLISGVYHLQNNCFAAVIEADCCGDVQQIFQEIQNKMKEKCLFAAGVVPIKRTCFKDVNHMLDCAMLTLKDAKNEKNDKLKIFLKEEIQQKVHTIALSESLKESVENGCEGFELYYQPLIRTGSYRIGGVEALLRYQCKEHGMVFPNEFIPILEKSGLIKEVGMWIFEKALVQCMEWRKSIPDLAVSVNLSMVQFEDENLAQKIADILKKTGMPGKALTIEITESMKLLENEQMHAVLKQLRSIGVLLALDDFGTGYSNVGHLKQFYVNEIKIDRSFITGLKKDTYNYRLISSLIEFAKENEICVCCEGVETELELAVVESLHTDLVQGYLFDRPLDAGTLEARYMDDTSMEYRAREENFLKFTRNHW